MLMGSADAIPTAPTAPVVFVEDLPESAQAKAAMVCAWAASRLLPCVSEAAALWPTRSRVSQKNFSPGLENLGNTCYMNSTLQCLYSVPELRDALLSYGGAGGGDFDGAHRLTAATRDLFRDLRSAGDSVAPQRFLAVLRQLFPQFAAQSRDGHFMQQDAEECWTGIVETLRGKLVAPASADSGAASVPVIRELFGIDTVATLKSAETAEERREEATSFTLKCHVDASVNSLSDGFRLALDAQREARSESAGRDVVFSGTQQLTRLPLVLTVQLMRFFYKAATQEKCKILRAVTFPLLLDVYEFASPDLKAQLDAPRDRRKRADEAKLGVKMQPGAAVPAAAVAASQPVDADATMDDAPGASADAAAPPAHTGFYSLVALLTHKGRFADGGHYVAYVKQADGSWMEFDDERPIPRTEADILALKGGGDHPMAYLCLYRAELA